MNRNELTTLAYARDHLRECGETLYADAVAKAHDQLSRWSTTRKSTGRLPGRPKGRVIFRPDDWVVVSDGRIGRVFDISTHKRWVSVQLGADGPFEYHSRANLRLATPEQIAKMDGRS